MDFENLENNFHKQYGNLLLTEYQVNILEKYNINYKNFNNLQELIFYLEDYLNNTDDEELEELSNNISEFYYYHYTNK